MGEIVVGGAAVGGKRVEGSPLLEDRAGDVLSIARRCLRSAAASAKASSASSASAYQKAT